MQCRSAHPVGQAFTSYAVPPKWPNIQSEFRAGCMICSGRPSMWTRVRRGMREAYQNPKIEPGAFSTSSSEYSTSPGALRSISAGFETLMPALSQLTSNARQETDQEGHREQSRRKEHGKCRQRGEQCRDNAGSSDRHGLNTGLQSDS